MTISPWSIQFPIWPMCCCGISRGFQAEISDISPERQSESIYWAVHHRIPCLTLPLIPSSLTTSAAAKVLAKIAPCPLHTPCWFSGRPSTPWQIDKSLDSWRLGRVISHLIIFIFLSNFNSLKSDLCSRGHVLDQSSEHQRVSQLLVQTNY